MPHKLGPWHLKEMAPAWGRFDEAAFAVLYVQNFIGAKGKLINMAFWLGYVKSRT
jgi:hypothetical protein